MNARALRVVVRADAGPRLGSGHVMRCLALAQALRDIGAVVTLVSAELPESLRDRWKAESADVESCGEEAGTPADARATLVVARETQADWIVLDGYQFDARYQRILKDGGPALLVVDDHVHAQEYCADIILNQNVHADAALYPRRSTGTRLLLGLRHVLLRREFWCATRLPTRVPEVASRILVTLGGADAENVSLKVLRALSAVSNTTEIAVIVGASNPHRAILEGLVAGWKGTRIHADVADMSEPMAWAHLAISGAGSTSWELAFMGVPNLSLSLADNQVGVARGVDAEGVGVNLGWHHDLTEARLAEAVHTLLHDAEHRQQMHDRGPRLVDGQGGRRVCQAMAAEEACHE